MTEQSFTPAGFVGLGAGRGAGRGRAGTTLGTALGAAVACGAGAGDGTVAGRGDTRFGGVFRKVFGRLGWCRTVCFAGWRLCLAFVGLGVAVDRGVGAAFGVDRTAGRSSNSCTDTEEAGAVTLVRFPPLCCGRL
jgi:hypothetical protein